MSGETPHGGDESLAVTAEALPVAQGTTAVGIGHWHRCAILEGGHVKCWGSNYSGELGQGDRGDRGDSPEELGDHLPPVQLGVGRTAKAVAGGYGDTCAILDNDLMKCWGNAARTVNSFHGRTFGDVEGEMGDNLPYVALGTGRTAKAVGIGDDHGCVLLDTNQVKCWGWGSGGRLGNGSNDSIDLGALGGDNVPVVDFGAGRSVKALSVGYAHTCVILDTNQVKCWGDNTWGQLGIGDENTRGDGPGEMGGALPVVNLGTGRWAKAVSAGRTLSCALLDNDQVKCWGSNANGCLGIGNTQSRGDGPNEMGDALPTVNFGNGVTVKSVGASSTSACALLSTNQVKCWGEGDYGRLGQGNTDDKGDQPGEVANMPHIAFGAGRTVRSLAVGDRGQCVVLDNNDLKCWGWGLYGALGLGDTNDRGDNLNEMGDNLPAVPLGSSAGGLGFATTAVGGAHSCSLRGNNAVKCWGWNEYGQLGRGHTSTLGDQSGEITGLAAVQLGTGRTARRVTAGGRHSCALLDNGKVKCWGNNANGQLGVGHTSPQGDSQFEVGDALAYAELGTGRVATEIDAGTNHTCALLDTNELKCWGFAGAIGLGSVLDRGDGPNEMGDNLPAVSLPNRVRGFSAGGTHTCAIVGYSYDLQCWGGNAFGQLGSGDTVARGTAPGDMGNNLPVVSLGTDVNPVQVSAGLGHTCVRFYDGRVKCFGRNQFGELGLGNTQNRGDGPNEMGDALPFVNLGTNRTARWISAGDGFTCAWLDNDQVKCWGRNGLGMLGLGNIASRGDQANEMGDFLPTVFLGNGYSVRKLSVGDNHVCARTHNAGLKCWGGNELGQLGLGNTQHRGDQANEMGDLLPLVPLSTP